MVWIAWLGSTTFRVEPLSIDHGARGREGRLLIKLRAEQRATANLRAALDMSESAPPARSEVPFTAFSRSSSAVPAVEATVGLRRSSIYK